MRWLSPPDSVPEARDKRQIIEADVDEKGQPLADFLQDARGDFVALVVELLRQRRRTIRRACAHRKFGDFADMLAGDLDRQRFRLQAVAVAGLAGRRAS